MPTRKLVCCPHGLSSYFWVKGGSEEFHRALREPELCAQHLNGLRSVVIPALGLPHGMQTISIPELFEVTILSSQVGSEQVDSRCITTRLGRRGMAWLSQESHRQSWGLTEQRPEPATCGQSTASLVTETPLFRGLGDQPSG